MNDMENNAQREVSYPDSNRIGKMLIARETLRDGTQRPMLQALFGLCIILEVGDHESGRGKEYIAASELFEPLAEGEEIPEYRIEQATLMPFAQADHEARRLNSGAFGFVAIRRIIVRVPAIAVRASAQVIH